MADRACPRKDGGVCFVPDAMRTLRVRDGWLVAGQAGADINEGLHVTRATAWVPLAVDTVGPRFLRLLRSGTIQEAPDPIKLPAFEGVDDGLIVQCMPCGDIWIVPSV